MDDGVAIDDVPANMVIDVVRLRAGFGLEDCGGSVEADAEENEDDDGGGGRCTEQRDLSMLDGGSGGAMIGGRGGV